MEENNNWYSRQEKLIIKIQNEKNRKAENELLNDYYKLLVKLCIKATEVYKYSPLTFDDYFQYAVYKFFERTKKYDFESEMNFASYIKEFVNLDLTNYAKKYTSNKHKTLNFATFKLEDYIVLFEEEFFSINDINFSILKKEQLILLKSIIENEGDIKKVSKELNIPIKTIYRKRQTILKKLNIQNNIE